MLFPSWAEADSFCCEPDFPWNLITFVTVLDTRGQRRWSFMCWVFIREWSQDKHVGKGWGGWNPCSQEARLHLSLTASSGQARMLRMAASGENRPTYTFIWKLPASRTEPLAAVGNFFMLRAKSLQSCPTRCDPMDCSLPGSSVHGDSPGKNTGVGCCALLQGIPNPRINLGVLCHLHWQAGSLPLVPPGRSTLFRWKLERAPLNSAWGRCSFTSNPSGYIFHFSDPERTGSYWPLLSRRTRVPRTHR